MARKDYSTFSQEELVAEIQRLEKRKKYGLVWEDRPEDKRIDLAANFPVFEEVKTRAISKKKGACTNLLIEGDNYHSLAALTYTHHQKIDLIYIDPPYNTGAKDWKYNNNFVEKEDSYRHSFWLSMMNNRLKLAKDLLKPGGVLICAIDENEMTRLGLLLEDIFKNHELHCVTIVHNPRGVQGKNFSYTHEYAYFSFPKGRKIIGPRKVKPEDVKWSNFRNWGGESERSDAKNCFYPVIIENDEIVGFGEVCRESAHPKQTVKNGNQYFVYPIDGSGIERKWRYARQSVEEVHHLLRAKKVKSGYEIEIGKDFGSVVTVWQDPRYDASVYGTKLVNSLVPENEFDFPKSIWTTYDCIAPILGENKNAIVLDFFAGSGTTGHAVEILNSEDDGNRQYILCTNNENGIARDVTFPRLKSVMDKNSDYPEITGLLGNLRYFKTTLISGESTDANKKNLTKKASAILCVKEGTHNLLEENDDFHIYENETTCLIVIFEAKIIPRLKKFIRKNKKSFRIYVFSLSDDTYAEDFAEFGTRVESLPIPKGLLNAYNRVKRLGGSNS